MSLTNDIKSDNDAEKDSKKGDNRFRFTEEQRIVTAVWFHERRFNLQSFEELQENFQIRFDTAPPSYGIVHKWEKTLFSSGTLRTNFKLPKRLTYVPFVKASLKKEPNLSARVRARKLGISLTNLKSILKSDLLNRNDIGKDVCDMQVEENKIKDEPV